MIETIVNCYITSKDLREIADKMEQIEKDGKPGSSVVADEWMLDARTRIKFTLDQDRFWKQKRAVNNQQ